MGAGQDRLNQEKCQDRQREGEKESLARIGWLADFPPRRAQEHQQQNWTEDAELHRDIVGEPERVDVGIVPSDIGLGVPNGGEAVFGVPYDIGSKQRRGDERGRETSRAS